jgi:MFS family permease
MGDSAAAAALIAMRCALAPGWRRGLLYPAISAMAVTAVRVHERGCMMAVFTGSFALGLAGGSTFLGPVAAHGGYPLVFLVAGCGTLVALAILVGSPALRAAGFALRPSIVGAVRSQRSARWAIERGRGLA